MGGGVYVYRARKPAARLRIPILSFHFAYVGETTSFYHRHQQHTIGDTWRGTAPKPWSDLDPRCVLRIPLPPWKWLLHLVETLVILCTWPVYNHSKNLWNPRRISLRVAATQRRMRDRSGWTLNYTWAHALLPFVAALVAWLVSR